MFKKAFFSFVCVCAAASLISSAKAEETGGGDAIDARVRLLEAVSLYDSPYSASPGAYRVAPQEVRAHRKLGDWYQIGTSVGLKWVKTQRAIVGELPQFSKKVVLQERVRLHNLPADGFESPHYLAPQTVTAFEEWGDWWHVYTGAGPKWVRRATPFAAQIALGEFVWLFDDTTGESRTAYGLSPQMVKAFEKSDGWYRVYTGVGAKWIKPSKAMAGDSQKIARTIPLKAASTKLRSIPFDSAPVTGTLAPQIVQSFEEWNGWLRISTGIGPMWIRVEQPLLSFYAVSDTHMNALDAKTSKYFQDMLADVKRTAPGADALIDNGDIGEGRYRDYQQVSALMKSSWHPPTFFTVGNHEFYSSFYDDAGNWSPGTYPNGETDQSALAKFYSFTGLNSPYYDRQIGGYEFIFLGSEKSRLSDSSIGDDAWLSQTQLNWLEARLRANYAPNKPMFVFLHQPLPNTVAGSSVSGNDRAIVQHEQLKAILSKYKEAVFFTGHTHWELNNPKTLVRENFAMVNTSSASEPWSAANEPITGDGGEGMYVEVYPDKIVFKGRSFAKRAWIPQAQYEVPLN